VAIKLAQIETFPSDYEALTKNARLPSRSRLTALRPFKDEQGLLRVGGPLRKAPIPDETRHQIILDPKHEVTLSLDEEDVHERFTINAEDTPKNANIVM
jgi:hypothetical protein